MVIKTWNNSFVRVGSRLVNGNITYSNSTVTDSGSQDTVSHPRPYTTGGPWSLSRERSGHSLVTGKYFASGAWWSYQDWHAANRISNGVNAVLESTSSINDLLARSNPSRPVADLPVFFSELRELPQLVWKAGGGIPKGAARANLAFEFGWEPIVRDLKALLDFQSHVSKRTHELSRLYQTGGQKSQGEMGSGSYRNAPVFQGVTGSTFPSQLWYTSYGAIRRWGSVSWVPDEDVSLGIPPVNELRRRAMIAVLGATVDLSTVWNALPWTWFIDWFSDVGSFLSSRRNVVGYVPGQCYQMTHSYRGTQSEHRNVGSGLTFLPGYYVAETKLRQVVVPGVLSAQAGFLSGRQIGILASLYVLKR